MIAESDSVQSNVTEEHRGKIAQVAGGVFNPQSVDVVQSVELQKAGLKNDRKSHNRIVKNKPDDEKGHHIRVRSEPDLHNISSSADALDFTLSTVTEQTISDKYNNQNHDSSGPVTQTIRHLKVLSSASNEVIDNVNQSAAINSAERDIINRSELPALEVELIYPPMTESDIIHKRQYKLLDFYLRNYHLVVHQAQPISRINRLVEFLTGGKNKDDNADRLDSIVSIILNPQDLYGAEKKEKICIEQKMAIIAEFMDKEILGMKFEEWVVQVMFAEKELQKKISHSQLNKKIEMKLLATGSSEPLSEKAYTYYLKNVVNNYWPSRALLLSSVDESRFHSLDITKPEWGFLQAGAKFLSDSGVELAELAINEIEEVGMYLEILFSQQMLPPSFAEYFSLPALIHYANTAKTISDSNNPDESTRYENYFNYIRDEMENNNPFIKFEKLRKDWKTRPEIAKKILAERNVSIHSFVVASYLTKVDVITFIMNKMLQANDPLPNADLCFSEQNDKLADAFLEIDKITLLPTFSSLNESEINFISQSEVYLVRMNYMAKSLHDHRYLPPYRYFWRKMEGPVNIEFLEVTKNNEQRIYALGNLSNNIEPKNEILWVDENKIMSFIKKCPNMKYYIDKEKECLLKESGETLSDLIINLAKSHRNKFLTSLHEMGYKETTAELIGDFFINLVPFYTCAKEIKKKNTGFAVLTCGLDIVFMLPFLFKALYVGGRFGVELGFTSYTSLKYAAKQLSLKMMLSQAGKQLTLHIPAIAAEISPKVIKELSIRLLFAADPGVLLLRAAGRVAIKTLLLTFEHITKKTITIQKLILRLKEALKKSGNVSLNTIKETDKKVIYSPRHKQHLTVFKIGERRGQALWVQYDSATGLPFGRKFITNVKGELELAPLPLRQRLTLILHQGMGGKGAQYAVKIWEKQDAIAVRSLSPQELSKLTSGAAHGVNSELLLSETKLLINKPTFTLESKYGVSYIETTINGNSEVVNFDAEKNAFFKVITTPAKKGPQYYILPPPIKGQRTTAHAGTQTLVELTDIDRVISDAQRNAILKGLNIDITFPLLLPELKNTKPIPQQIICIWVGDKVIPDNLIKNIQSTARVAKSGTCVYKTNLYISREFTEAYTKNLSKLGQLAPDVNVIVLENTPFYLRFMAGKYNAHYQAAIVGNGGKGTNFASAADVLRYQLMYDQGGLYMDIDDVLVSKIDTKLKTSTNSLLLHSPVDLHSIEKYAFINNSNFGTLAKNPTLERISEESYKRFSANPDMYKNKPNHLKDKAGFKTYMGTIYDVSGPGVFNDVIDQELPVVKRLKSLIGYINSGNRLSAPNDYNLFHIAKSDYLGLSQKISIGSQHSWFHTRR